MPAKIRKAPTSKLFSNILFALAALCLMAPALAASDSMPSSSEAEMQVEALAEVGSEVVLADQEGSEPAGDTEIAPEAFELNIPTDREIRELSSCLYTCPFNMVRLCPNFPGLTKSCVNGCCTYR